MKNNIFNKLDPKHILTPNYILKYINNELMYNQNIIAKHSKSNKSNKSNRNKRNSTSKRNYKSKSTLII